MLLVFEATVYRHQVHHYSQVQRSPPAVQTLFPAATRDTLDQGLVTCLKYLLNYAFYKFGLEVCVFKQQPLLFTPHNSTRHIVLFIDELCPGA